MKRILSAAVAAVMCIMTASANELHLKDDNTLQLKKFGETDATGLLTGDGIGEDSVVITEISLQTPFTSKTAFSVKDAEGNAVFENNLKRSLVASEMKPFTLYRGNKYTVVAGDRTWTIDWPAATAAPEAAPEAPEQGAAAVDSVAENAPAEAAADENKKGLSWWVWLLIGFAIGLCSELTVSYTRKRKTAAAAEADEQPEGTDAETVPGAYVAQKPLKVSCLDDVLNYLPADLQANVQLKKQAGASDQELLEMIRTATSDYKEKADNYTEVARTLHVDKPSPTFLDLLEAINLKINSVKEKTETVDTVEGPDVKQIEMETLQGVVEIIRRQKETCKIYDLKDAQIGTDDIREILRQFIGAVNAKLAGSDKLASASEAHAALTPQDLDKADNRIVLRNWLVGELGAAKITGFDKNKTILEILEQVAAQIGQKDERPSDAEIVSQAIMSDNLTDADRKAFITGLIKLINDEIKTPGHKFPANMTDSVEFVSAIAAKYDEPLNTEEAQKMATAAAEKKDAEIVSAALGVTVSEIDKAAIETAASTFAAKRVGEAVPAVKAADLAKTIELVGKLKSEHDSFETSDKAKAREITSLNGKVAALNADLTKEKGNVATLTGQRDALATEKADAKAALLELLRDDADAVGASFRVLLNPCSDAEEEQCLDIEKRLRTAVAEMTARLKAVKPAADATPAQVREAIRRALIAEIELPEGAVNTICRYYAYSRLPFMTDSTREYGITFNRKNMTDLFNALNSMMVDFGLRLDIPSLFAASLAEGNFVSSNGEAYSDLDNLCPNARNHKDTMDSSAKPADVLIDIVSVGYSAGAGESRPTSVLTY